MNSAEIIVAANGGVRCTNKLAGLVVNQTGAMEQTIPNTLCFINADKKHRPRIAVSNFSNASSLFSFGSADDVFNQVSLWS